MLIRDVEDWYEALLRHDPRSAPLVAAALDLLQEHGPNLCRPLVGTLHGGSLPNPKELRPGSSGRSEMRILFAFDPQRNAVLLVAVHKAGKWKDWYRRQVPIAEERFEKWLTGEYDN